MQITWNNTPFPPPPTVLSAGKLSPESIPNEAGWSPEPVLTFREEKHLLFQWGRRGGIETWLPCSAAQLLYRLRRRVCIAGLHVRTFSIICMFVIVHFKQHFIHTISRGNEARWRAVSLPHVTLWFVPWRCSAYRCRTFCTSVKGSYTCPQTGYETWWPQRMWC